MKWGIKRGVVVALGAIGMNILAFSLLASSGVVATGWTICAVNFLLSVPVMINLTSGKR